MTLQHPLDKLSAVVDGELDHDSRDKVLSHLVSCDDCRSEVDAQRRLKARLAAVADPEPSMDLLTTAFARNLVAAMLEAF